MPPTSTDLFHEWRVANRMATAAERSMLHTSIQALEGKGEPPSADEAQRIRRLRAAADDLFQRAMVHMTELAVMARNGGRGVASSAAVGAAPRNLTDPRG